MIEIFHCLKFQEFVKRKTFSIGENGMNPLGILPLPQNNLPKGLEDMSIAFVNELNRLKC